MSDPKKIVLDFAALEYRVLLVNLGRAARAEINRWTSTNAGQEGPYCPEQLALIEEVMRTEELLGLDLSASVLPMTSGRTTCTMPEPQHFRPQPRADGIAALYGSTGNSATSVPPPENDDDDDDEDKKDGDT